MPVAGERKSTQLGKSYLKDPMSSYVASFRDLAKNILNESGTDLFTEPRKAMLLSSSNDAMKNFFVENSADRNGFESTEEYDDHLKMMEEQYLNDREAVLEYAALGEFNPVIGMTFPIHKNLLMNCIFDKGAIPKAVAVAPKFTISMETRYLITPDGEEIDMFKEQHKMKAAIDSTIPFVDVDINLPEQGTTDILTKIGASSLDNLDIETEITAVKVECNYKAGDKLPDGTVANTDTKADTWIETSLRFKPGYGEFDRSLIESVTLPANATSGEKEEVISGTMHKNRFQIMALKGIVKAVRLTARKDSSNGLVKTCSVRWGVKTDIVEIGTARPINVPIAPEEVKDIGALYQVNQLTKVMSMIKLTLENYKDDSIKEKLDTSFRKLDPSQKISSHFDFAPRAGYALDHVEWRQKTFFDFFDTQITKLVSVLNDPNMVITVFGRPDLIRKITPTEYTYQTPSSIGPIDLNFTKTVTTSDKRVYQFISSQKITDDDLIIILCPRNSERIIYRIYDYQMYVSNEIRNAALYTLPAVHAFERWKFVQYQPVQGRISILNPSGLTNQ